MLEEIVAYTLQAVAFALPVTLIVTAARHLCFRKKSRVIQKRQELLYCLFIFYTLALVEITVIRGGTCFTDFASKPHGFETVQLIPLATTINEAQSGAWAVIYHIIGNIAWFLPLGLLLTLMRPNRRLLSTMAVCLLFTVSIEALQWLFQSGISDIDDVIFNLAGGLLGCFIGKITLNFRYR